MEPENLAGEIKVSAAPESLSRSKSEAKHRVLKKNTGISDVTLKPLYGEANGIPISSCASMLIRSCCLQFCNKQDIRVKIITVSNVRATLVENNYNSATGKDAHA